MGLTKESVWRVSVSSFHSLVRSLQRYHRLFVGKVVASKPAGMAWRSGILHVELESVDLVTQQSQSLQATTSTKGPPTNAVNDWVNAIDQTQGRKYNRKKKSHVSHNFSPRTLCCGNTEPRDLLSQRRTIAACTEQRQECCNSFLRGFERYELEPDLRVCTSGVGLELRFR